MSGHNSGYWVNVWGPCWQFIHQKKEHRQIHQFSLCCGFPSCASMIHDSPAEGKLQTPGILFYLDSCKTMSPFHLLGCICGPKSSGFSSSVSSWDSVVYITKDCIIYFCEPSLKGEKMFYTMHITVSDFHALRQCNHAHLYHCITYHTACVTWAFHNMSKLTELMK